MHIKNTLAKSVGLIAVIFFTSVLYFNTAQAQSSGGTNGGGGGDPCENKIKTIRKDIKKWIIDDRHFDVPRLPFRISHQRYSRKMLAGVNFKVSCVQKGDPGFPVLVFGQPKVCRFDYFENSKKIFKKVTCDYNKFMATSAQEQYKLIHHEIAGLAQLELPNKDESKYELTNMIMKYFKIIKTKQPSESPCRTHGCDDLKQARTEAILKWINESGECSGMVWLKSLNKVSDDRFVVRCGDASDDYAFNLETVEDLNADPESYAPVTFKAKQIVEDKD